MSTKHSTADGRILGRLGSADGRGVVTVRDTYDTDLDDLWSAVTDPGRLARWIGTIEGDLQPGGRFRASFFTTGWEGTGVVETCEPPRHWRVRTIDAEEVDESGEAAEHTLEATLVPDGDRTILIIEERGMPWDQLAAYGAGLQVHLEDLAAHVAGRDRRDTRERWGELLPTYQVLAEQVST